MGLRCSSSCFRRSTDSAQAIALASIILYSHHYKDKAKEYSLQEFANTINFNLAGTKIVKSIVHRMRAHIWEYLPRFISREKFLIITSSLDEDQVKFQCF